MVPRYPRTAGVSSTTRLHIRLWNPLNPSWCTSSLTTPVDAPPVVLMNSQRIWYNPLSGEHEECPFQQHPPFPVGISALDDFRQWCLAEK